MNQSLLEVENLTTKFSTSKGDVTAINNISLKVDRGETVCIVGESGCGKSMTVLSILGLLPKNGKIAAGKVKFQGKELNTLSKEQMREIRGKEISMIFQEPMTALNPVFTIGFQLRESLMIHTKMTKKQANERAIGLLDKVGIPSSKKRLEQYPHELSGGMRQRVMIAMALASNPALLLADEPTTALDVTIQAQILGLIQDLKDQYNMGLLLITHDMGVVAEIADRVIIMYAGKIVEEGTVEEIFTSQKHPYTEGLLKSVPDVDNPDFKLQPIPGTLPNISDEIPGCRFHPRCKYAMDICKKKDPISFTFSPDHYTNCWLYEKDNQSDVHKSISKLSAI
ncbi:ABC transporter ATP-binding protein [Bacillus sp. JJ1773]|uniref:ABC transporter ATP-binding protein n=1 Tax=Bacillus sp. JJ1773 TaxID=3122965 RepID=UPI002FFD690D